MLDLKKAKSAGSYREFKQTASFEKYIRFESQTLLNLASNDYLGIATSRNLRDEFLDTVKAKDVFFGSGASRLVYNSSEAFYNLENWFESRFQKKALIFNSGYSANLGIISALADPKTLFIADKLIHASMIDALQLSRANFKRFAHNNIEALSRLLELHHSEYETIIVLTEAVFSMDGDFADLPAMIALKKKYPNVKLYVDEAHSFFALHELGLSRALNLDADVDFILVTLSKALGGSGAVFLCNDEIRQILINSARSLIFSTAIPSIDVAWTHFVLSKDFSARRQILHDLIRFLELSDSQICPFIVGENEDALLLSRKLLQQGFFVPAIRPPTVPLHTARLRISLRGDITPEELASLKEILDAYKAAHAG